MNKVAEIERELPYLRRYARVLTGSQESGDTYAILTLEAIVEDPEGLKGPDRLRVALFRCFHAIWSSSGRSIAADAFGLSELEAVAQDRLAGLTENAREALLLNTIEDFSTQDIGRIMGIEPGEAAELIEIGTREIADRVAGKVMIIEDEAIIAMDIKALVEGMGHSVTGIARTRDEAVRLARDTPPDLLLADVQLADNSSGIDAANDILAQRPDLPVVFITAFPERLLTGSRPEPAFLITKPFRTSQVRSAVGQALFFASTETLHA